MLRKRVVAILMVAVLMPVAAIAQEWKPYSYPDPGFTIQFPGIPAVATSTIKDAFGVLLPVTRYAVRQERMIYTLSVVNYSNTNVDSLSTIAQTEKALGTSGKVTAAAGARINRHFGRELSVNGADGIHSAIAIFFVNNHLYTVVGQALPPNAGEDSADAIRFLESLQFADDASGFGFGRLFGGGGNRAKPVASPHAEPRAEPHVDSRAEPRANAHADATCAGKSAGDAVQLETSAGPVAATCTLVARPNVPQSPAPAH